MKFISVCSGIEAASIAFAPLGWKAVAFSEIEPFPKAVLAYRFPDMGDMTRFMGWPDELFRQADMIVGGPPCQSFSVAGLRKGLDDKRGNITLTYVKLINHADSIRAQAGLPPVIVIYENVPGLLSDKTNAFGHFLGGLAGDEQAVEPPSGKWKNTGVVVGPERLAVWRIHDAQFHGVAQRRRRIFCVGVSIKHPRAWAIANSLLSLTQSVSRNSAPSRETRQDVAGTISSRTTGGGGLGTDFELAGGIQRWPAEVAPTLDAHYGEKMGLENQHINGWGGLFVRSQMSGNKNEVGRGDGDADSYHRGSL